MTLDHSLFLLQEMNCFVFFFFQPSVGETAGNYITMLAVTEGLKFTACSPTFIDARNGILDAIEATFQPYPRNFMHCYLWEAFARRGVGFNAATSSNGVGDESQEFSTSRNTFLFFYLFLI
jgi:extracellular elastinolytic metalloproteinase